MKASKLLSVLAVAGLAFAFTATSTTVAFADPAKDKPAKTEKQDKADKTDKSDKKDEKKKDEVKMYPGASAPNFTLTDTDGKSHTLADMTKSGKVVVIQWFNPDCPFVVKHYDGAAKTFNALHEKYASKGVEFVAINSGAKGKQGAGLERNQKAKKDWSIAYPVLLDETGEVGKSYNAKNTPLMVVIGKDGKVAYYGAIDDNNSGKEVGKTNYVANALDEILAGKPVSTAETKPYGCSVKYAN